MTPALDPLESRQLLSTAGMSVHKAALAHHHHSMRLHHAAVVGRAHSGHHGAILGAMPAAVTGLRFVPSPQFSGGLLATAAIADNDIWAVGFNAQVPPPPAPFVPTLAEHFDGTSWSVVPTPPLPSGGVNGPGGEFFGVAAAASNDVWAVGFKVGPGNPDFGLQLIEHWDGTAWSQVTSPEIEGDSLNGVTAISANNVWAVGSDRSSSGGALVEHWDGTSWRIVSNSVIAAAGALSAVSADSANDVWAVGPAGNTGPPILHFDGTTWSRVATPTGVRSVTALSPTNVWAVGTVQTLFNHRPHTRAAIEHWDGRSWSIVSSPNPTPSPGLDSLLDGIAAISANDIWAVGTLHTSQFGQATLTEHWDGTSWTIISSPDPGTFSNALNAVTALSDGTVTAVGSRQDNDRFSPLNPLILQN
jgi:hypothetical protein